MIISNEYHTLVLRSKVLQRAHLVETVFGSQTALAEALGVTQSAISHVIALRSRSQRIEAYILQRIREVRPDLEKLWLCHGKRTSRKRQGGAESAVKEKVGGLAA